MSERKQSRSAERTASTPEEQDSTGEEVVDPATAENESAEDMVEGTQVVPIPTHPTEGETGGRFEGDPNRYPASEEDLPRSW